MIDSAVVLVGYTSERPVVPDQHATYVAVAAASEQEACLLAAQLVASRLAPVHAHPRCEMVTSTTIVSVVM